MKMCPKCGAKLKDTTGGYLCFECGRGIFREDEVIVARCPYCNKELSDICGDYYCYSCAKFISEEKINFNKNICSDKNHDFEEPDYDLMMDNGDNICLNCTYWSVSPYGAAHGMVCRRGQLTEGPGDSCSSFVQSTHFASYGDNGQYQFNETRRNTANKLYHWRNNR